MRGHRRSPLLAAALLLITTLHCSDPAEPVAEGGVEQVILIGVDGLDWRVLDELIARGGMPNLARFIENGASGELETLLPAYSPRLWASIATGKLPAKHGITGFAERRPDGSRVPYTSNARRARALWNILGDAGRKVAVVGWWTTWPAEPVNGVMVSDRMMYNRYNVWLGLAHYGADLPAQTHPPELFDELVDATRVPPELDRELLDRFGPARPAGPIEESLHDPWYELLLVYARDRAYHEILDRVLSRDSFDFIAYYVNGPDIASHYFWKHRFPEEWDEPIPEPEMLAGREVVDRYYSYVDGMIGPLLDRADESCVVIVLSDHGFVTGRRSDSPNISGTHYDTAPPGMIALAGGDIPSAAKLGRAGVVDVTPTVLHALGLPVGRDMDGRVLAVGADRPVAFVETHETSAAVGDVQPIPSEHDEAILEKLKALGYIGSE